MTRLRLLAILASALIPIYILLPTVFGGSAENRFQQSVSGVEIGRAATDDAMEVRFAARGGDATALKDALVRRLSLAGVGYDSAVVTDSGEVRVRLRVGSRREQVIAAAAATTDVQIFGTDGLPEGVTGSEEEVIAGLRARWVGQAVPTEARALRVTGAKAVDGTSAQLSLDLPVPALDGALAPVLVVRAGVVEQVRLATPATAEGPALLTLSEVEHFDAFLLAVQAGPMPGELTVVEKQVEEVAGEVAATDGGFVLPEWLRALLPDTEINMGIDLRGGIDLTLQVELDEAVLSQVARDLAYVRDAAKNEGIEITAARRSRYEPWMLLESTAPFEQLKEFVHTRMTSYYYLETQEEAGRPVHVFALKEAEVAAVEKAAVEQVLETLRKRVDETGVKEPTILQKGGGRINVQLPGEVDFQTAIDAIGTTAVLEFRMVDEEFDQAELSRMLVEARDALPADQYASDAMVNDWLYQTGRLKEDHIVQWEYADDESGARVRDYAYPLHAEVILTGGDVNKASTAWDQQQQPYVSLEFKPRGANVFCRVTGDHVGKRFAILLDGEVRSAPNIRERICGGRASITMGQAEDAARESQNLALVLRTGSLNAPVSVGEVRQLGASLGKDAIESGILATVIGGAIVFLFMAIWYRTAGLIADVALAVNLLMVLALLALFGATLTLPGIAGLALTIGMAVDANIVIYERIKEELRMGQAPRKAVDLGFEKAATAILDSNFTTLIAGIVLYSYGTGPIKGFAVTLMVGIVTTLFAALFISRSLMELITRSSTARLRI